MKKENQLRLTAISAVTVIILLLPLGLLYKTYKNARVLAHNSMMANQHCDDCYYVKTALSFQQIYDPPALFYLPHWQVPYRCDTSTPAHGGTSYYTQAQTWTLSD